MIKQTIRWAFSKTPWRIVRAETFKDSFKEGAAIKHNLLEEWDEKFNDPAVLERYYSSARHKLNREIVATILRSRVVADGEVIGDVGCGLGYFLILATESFKGSSCYGYDFSEVGLATARQRCASATFEHHDIYDKLPRSHHVTVCSQTLEHLLDPYRAAQNLLQGTRAGGIAVFTVPDGRLDTYKGHINFWSPESWEEWVKSLANRRSYSCHRMSGGTAGGANLLATIYC